MAKEQRISAAPLFEKLKGKGAAAAFAGKLDISLPRLGNWRTRGIPAAMVADVAHALGMTTDAYLEAAGRPRRTVAKQPAGQYTLEAQKLLDDFYALPSGLQEHIARKASELRRYSDALPRFLRDALKPPSDPEHYRAWEREIEGDMERLKATPKKRS